MKQSLKRGLVMLAAFAGVVCPFAVHATDYTYSNVDSDSLAVKSDGKFGTTSFSFQLSNPSANAATADFPASGYVQLTSISIGARSDNDLQSVTTATLTNNKTSESYAATVTYSSGNDFTAVAPTSWSRKEVKITFGTDGVLVDTTATYTLTFTAKLGYSVVTTVASNTQTADWKPAMRIYGRTPSGSMEMPSSLIPSSGGMALPSTVTVADATGMAFANGSVTVGNGGISAALSSALSYHTVMVKVSNIPSSSCRLIAWLTGQYQSKDIENFSYYDGSNFCQSYILGGTKQGDYNTGNNRSWTRDASEHWVAASYARKDSESGCSQTSGGTRTYFDGAEKVTATGLKWGSNQTSKITIGGTSTNSGNPATGMVIEDVVILSNALTASQIATLTTALNAGWTVNAAGTTLTSSESLHALPGYANVSAIGTVTMASDGTISDLSGLTAVQVGNGATLDLSANTGLTQVIVLSGGELTIGKQRPGSVVVMTGGILNVSSVPTASECITGYIPTAELSVENSAYLTGTVKLEGETVTPSFEGTTATLTGTIAVAANPTYTGSAWWWDYEFNESSSATIDGYRLTTPNAGNADNVALRLESSNADYTSADETGNRELYFQQTPWRNASFNSMSELTAVMYCAPGNYANTVLVGFGSTTANDQKAIALVTGANPAAGQMKLVLTDGHDGGTGTVTELADLTAVGATTTKHLYAFTMDRITEDATTKTRVRVYLDGKVKAIYKHSGTLTLSNGFQIGSLHGGVAPRAAFNTGLSKYANSGNSGTLDFLRVIDGTLTDAAMSALAEAYPYHSEFGAATRDPVSSAASWVSDDAWTQTIPEREDATQNAPNTNTNVTLSKDGSSDVSVAINLAEDTAYESLTLTKEAGATGSLKLTSAYGNNTTGKLVSAETSVLVDTVIPAGRVQLGVTSIADGVTVTVDPFSVTGNYTIYDTLTGLGFGEIYEDVVISMALLGDGASVALDETNLSDLEDSGFTAELVHNLDNLSYTFKVTREAATADIAVNVTSGGVVTWSTRNIDVPAPESLPNTYAGTVTITSASASPVTVATAFAGGDLTVSSGTVILTGDITTSGTVALNSATTLSGNTVSSALTGSGAVTIDGTVTLADGGSIANTIGGTGTIDGSGRTSAPGAFAFGTWTGTVVLPELAGIAGDTFSFNSYGITGSTVRVNGIGGGWLRSEEVNPTIDIPAGKTLTISAFSPSFNNTFKKLSGAGTFAVTHSAAVDTTAGDWYENYSAYYLIKDVSGFTGSLSTATPGIAIGSSKPGYQTAGGKIMVTGTLTGSCTLDEDVTFASGATLDATAGVPTVAGAVTLGGTLNVEMGDEFTPAAYTGATAQKALSASASGLTADTVLTAATVKADGSAVSNAVVVVKAGGLYAVLKPTVPTSGDDVPEGVTSDVAEAIAKKAAVAGAAEITSYKNVENATDNFSADRAVLFPESLKVSAEGEVSTDRPTFGIKSLTVKAVSSTNYVIIQAEAHNLADGGDIVLAGDLTESSAAATVKEALKLTNGTSEGVTTKWFVLDLPGSTTAYGVKATNE